MSRRSEETGITDSDKIEQQRRFLPPPWRRCDRAVLRATEIGVFAIGAAFTAMVTLEVASRYVFSFSIFFVNAAARLLLVWFFVIGAGLALRHGAHVGFELVLSLVPPRRRHMTTLTAQVLALAFFAEMVWAGVHALGPAMRQTEPGLEISLFWAFLSIPTGFVLLTYHMLVLMAVELGRRRADEPRP